MLHNIVDKLAVRIGTDGVFLSLLSNVHIVKIGDDIREDTEAEVSEIGEKVNIFVPIVRKIAQKEIFASVLVKKMLVLTVERGADTVYLFSARFLKYAVEFVGRIFFLLCA